MTSRSENRPLRDEKLMHARTHPRGIGDFSMRGRAFADPEQRVCHRSTTLLALQAFLGNFLRVSAPEPLRFGLITPVVSLVPGQCSPWEEAAGAAELREIARVADELGYHHLTCSEHIGVPTSAVKARGPRFYDQLATLGFVAALTHRIKLVTHIVVLPYHHPLAVAKRYGTLDALSGGRLILGCGVGSLKEEFELLGVDFDGRGVRYEEALEALRVSLGRRQPCFQGEHYRFSDFVIDPCAVQERVPIWLGGRTARSLRRAIALTDGWDPFGLDLEALARLITAAKESPEWRARTARFDFVLGLERRVDLTQPGQLEGTIDMIQKTRTAGATTINLLFSSKSLSHYLEQLELFKAEIAPKFA
jgi:probable F420-dependent oxidoreductase